MCGLSVIINNRNKPIDRGEVEKSLSVIEHRGPDHKGILINENVGLGHRRLSIIELTDKGNQPFQFKHLTVVFNGEIYNYLELRKFLQSKNFHFETNSDTEVLIIAYYYWGQKCVDQFKGIWAFAIYDELNKTIFCSRDRFGVKPLNYSIVNNNFCLVSEIKQLTVLKGWTAQLNKEICFDWLVNGLKNHNKDTFFSNVSQLAPSHNLLYNLKTHQIEIKKYYDIKEEVLSNPLPKLTAIQAKNNFTHLFNNATSIQQRSDAKLGVSLSGGLDSTAILSSFKNNYQDNKTLSFSYISENPSISEKDYIDNANSFFKVDNYEIKTPIEEYWNYINKITWHQEEPLTATNVISNFLVFKKAKSIGIKVLLNGQGADEILAGYDACFKPYWHTLMYSNPVLMVRELIGFSYYHDISGFLRKNFRVISKTNNYKFILNSTLYEKAIERSLPRAESLLDYQFQLIQKRVLPMLLHYEDRNGMANSIEARVPFLDRELVEFCLKLPNKYKINFGKRKWVMREALKNKLPKKIYSRYDKLAFNTPPIVLNNKQIKNPNLLCLSSLKDFGLVNNDLKENDLLNNSTLTWKFIALEKFLKIFIQA